MFCNISLKVLNKHTPRKKEFARGTQMSFMTKDLSKEITKRWRLLNRFLKCKSQEMPYTQKRNYCASLLGNTKIRYYANLNEKEILDNKPFWMVLKPLFSDKSICCREAYMPCGKILTAVKKNPQYVTVNYFIYVYIYIFVTFIICYSRCL